MVLRNRDSRRLRVILDESTGAEIEPSSLVAAADRSGLTNETERPHKPKRMYGHGAERRGQPKTTDLIPKRWLSYSTLVALLISFIAALNAMAINATSLQDFIGEAGVAAFSLQGVGTFASWFTTVLLGSAAVVCLQVYYLRKHRCDDYRGSYRLWFWASIAFLVGSVSGTVGLGQIIENLLAATVGDLPSIGPVSIIVVAACMVLAAMVLLGVWETRASRGTTALIVVAWLAGSCSILSAVPQVQDRIAQANLTLVAANAWPLFANSAFLAVLTYARHVYLAANGMLPVREVVAKPAKSVAKKKAVKPTVKAKKKPASKPVTKKSASPAVTSKTKPVATDTPRNRMEQIREQAAAKKAADQATASKQKSTQILSMDAGATTDEEPKLSKAERRRQRKLEKRQNRAA